MPFVNIKFIQGVKSLFEIEIEQEILKINPKTEFDDMDITEKLMLLSYISKSEDEKKKDEEEALPLEEILKEEGLNIDDKILINVVDADNRGDIYKKYK